jgi:transcriptional regulator with XRE-family HTH domain
MARRVRERRKARGLSLDQLARAAGISKTWLWELERAKGVPGIVVVAAIAKVLSCSIDRLVFGDVESHRREWVGRACELLHQEFD